MVNLSSDPEHVDAEALVLARALLQIGAVSLAPSKPFTWASGLKAPIYCDNRLTLGYPNLREHIAQGLARRIEQLDPRPDAVVGVATAGIPHATLAADRLGLPLAYVRAQAKSHGRGKQIEGVLEPGTRVAVIEDLISTGGSSLAAVDVLRHAGVEVVDLLALFSYGLPVAARKFEQAGVTWGTLTGFERLVAVAEADGLFSEGEIASLRSWQHDPEAWSAAHAHGA